MKRLLWVMFVVVCFCGSCNKESSNPVDPPDQVEYVDLFEEVFWLQWDPDSIHWSWREAKAFSGVGEDDTVSLDLDIRLGQDSLYLMLVAFSGGQESDVWGPGGPATTGVYVISNRDMNFALYDSLLFSVMMFSGGVGVAQKVYWKAVWAKLP